MTMNNSSGICLSQSLPDAVFIVTSKQKSKEKKDLTQSFNKIIPTPTEKANKQRENTKKPPKLSITQRLRTDLGWSVGVTRATPLVLLNRFTSV